MGSAREAVAAYCAMRGRNALIAECIVISAACLITTIAGCFFVLLEPVG
ncbi:MAG: hypothetical protein NTX28_06335 [Novosphingobium sp.]|nr:hypothetical protein [Novosphingobium sp.]